MVIVTRLLHQVNARPHKGITRNAPFIFIADHDKNAQQSHEAVIKIHSVSRKWLQEIEPNKIERKLRFDKCSANPAGENCSPSFKRN